MWIIYLRMLCEWKKVKIVEEVCSDQPVEISPEVSVWSFKGYFKGKSSVMFYEKFPGLEYKYHDKDIGVVDKVSRNTKEKEE